MTTQEERVSQRWNGMLRMSVNGGAILLSEMRAGFARLDAKIDNNHKWTIGLLITVLIAIIVGFAGIIAAIISG